MQVKRCGPILQVLKPASKGSPQMDGSTMSDEPSLVTYRPPRWWLLAITISPVLYWAPEDVFMARAVTTHPPDTYLFTMWPAFAGLLTVITWTTLSRYAQLPKTRFPGRSILLSVLTAVVALVAIGGMFLLLTQSRIPVAFTVVGILLGVFASGSTLLIARFTDSTT